MRKGFILSGFFLATLFFSIPGVLAHGNHPATRDLNKHVAYHLDEIRSKKGKTDFKQESSGGLWAEGFSHAR